MIIAVPRERRAGERRVAAIPETVRQLTKLGFDVRIESKAGAGASFEDGDYQHAGATIVTDTRQLWSDADIILKVQPPHEYTDLGAHEIDLIRPGATIVCFLWPGKNEPLLQRVAARKASAIAVDQIPRITRAQKMDALSSMANIAGYRAVIEAASFYGRFFTGQMTAAGRVPPAKVLVIGAGVAGLAAIGAARGLGAIVRAFDARSAVKDQVKSMGADFLELNVREEGEGAGGYAKTMSDEFIRAEMELFAVQAREVDIIITTALIPNRPAPVLITEDMVRSMKKGSVIVDLAAENGGNCALTEPNEVVEHHGVHIIGYVDLPSRLAPTASLLYGNNLVYLLADMGGAASFHIDLNDAVIRSALVVHNGEVTWPPPRSESSAVVPPVTTAAAPASTRAPQAGYKKPTLTIALVIFGAAALVGLGMVAPPAFLSHFTVFALACVVGWQVVWNVTPALHTPLMSVTNAISGIILIGGMLQLTARDASPALVLGAAAVLISTVNVAGGFLVTQRMLRMFRR
jgi:proton-translocating NAD(P)+ transhydrogenase subunit alpha